ncbi:MAG: amidohydrolase family protein [Phycisphaerae bacterium]
MARRQAKQESGFDRPWSVSADWILPGDGRRLRNGILRGNGPLVEAVGTVRQVPPTPNHRELGEVILLPGLINAHVHLELTHMRGKISPGRPITQWLYGIIRKRPQDEDQQRAAVQAGAAEALAAGTTCLVDVSSGNNAWAVLQDFPLRKICLSEIVGIGPRAKDAMSAVGKTIRGCKEDERLGFGISPHSPYATAESVYIKCIAAAHKRNWPVATRLAETEAERQFLTRGSGKFFEFLARLGMIDMSVDVHGCKPVEFARRVGMLDRRSLLFGVNYIGDDELAILQTSRASVVYSPGAAAYFGRSGHRYPEMLRRGINVALGTDSLACNDSLDVLQEMRRIRRDAQVDNDTILRMATLNGARALGMDDRLGSLEPGKTADFFTVTTDSDLADPLEAILTAPTNVQQVTIAGGTVPIGEGG